MLFRIDVNVSVARHCCWHPPSVACLSAPMTGRASGRVVAGARSRCPACGRCGSDLARACEWHFASEHRTADWEELKTEYWSGELDRATALPCWSDLRQISQVSPSALWEGVHSQLRPVCPLCGTFKCVYGSAEDMFTILLTYWWILPFPPHLGNSSEFLVNPCSARVSSRMCRAVGVGGGGE